MKAILQIAIEALALGLFIGAILCLVMFGGCPVEGAQPVRDSILRDECTAIERNWYYSDQGDLIFGQWIFWCGDLPFQNHVREWRMVKSVDGFPVKHGRWWIMRWQDGSDLREVRALSFYETWLQFDPELADREFLPPNERWGFKSAAKQEAEPFTLETAPEFGPPPEGP